MDELSGGRSALLAFLIGRVPRIVAPPASTKLSVKNGAHNRDRLIDVFFAVIDRFDAGVRLGEQVAKDMIALRLGPDIPMAIVASSKYLGRHGTPIDPDDLVEHRCINLRLPTSYTLNAWRFAHRGRKKRVRVEGQVVFNTIDLILDAALQGLGLA